MSEQSTEPILHIQSQGQAQSEPMVQAQSEPMVQAQSEPMVQAQSTQLESPWFWKIFGSAIISLITVLIALVGNNILTNITNTRTELLAWVNGLKEENINLREKVASLIQLKESTQAKITELEKSIKEVDNIGKQYKEKISVLEATVKEKAVYSEVNIATLKAADEKYSKELQEVRDRLIKIETKKEKE